VERPPYDVIVRETAALGFSAVGRKYGVSDNAVRKWMRWHEAHGEAAGGLEEAA
jgi:transposase-like protein